MEKYICANCGAVIEDEEAMITAQDGKTFCNEECAEEKDYVQCEHCGEWTDDWIETTDDRCFCSKECAEEMGYHKCTDCGDWEPNCVEVPNQGMVCEYCREHNAVAERGALLGNEVLRQADGYAIHRKTNGSRINYLSSSRHALHGRFFNLAANDIHHAACAGFAETGNSIGKLFRCACSEYIAVSQFTHISAWTNGLEYNGTVILRFVSINYYLA